MITHRKGGQSATYSRPRHAAGASMDRAAPLTASGADAFDAAMPASYPERIREMLRPPQAAAHLGCSVSYLNKLRMGQEGPPFVRLGARAVAYRRADLDRWAESRIARNTAEAKAQRDAARRRQEGVR